MARAASKHVFPFIGAKFDASAAAVGYTTPNAFAHTLGVLQAIEYKRAVFKAHNQSDAAATVRLRQGGTAIATLTLAANAAGNTELDVSGVSGAAAVTIEVEVTTAGTGTGEVFAFLDVEQPLQVSSC